LVSDPALKVAEAYGVRQAGMDVALPATILVDAKGEVSFVHIAKNPVDRLRADGLSAALRAFMSKGK